MKLLVLLCSLVYATDCRTIYKVAREELDEHYEKQQTMLFPGLLEKNLPMLLETEIERLIMKIMLEKVKGVGPYGLTTVFAGLAARYGIKLKKANGARNG